MDRIGGADGFVSSRLCALPVDETYVRVGDPVVFAYDSNDAGGGVSNRIGPSDVGAKMPRSVAEDGGELNWRGLLLLDGAGELGANVDGGGLSMRIESSLCGCSRRNS